ncbi:6-bladed beta-propeller [Parabacteroides chongii]|uniref:6-bladed beta-propeller n=1 Tax=Parabacteroides chongii TaxID=2685834 RepID=UPI00240E693A|nr:6-bladed beta-propeller [Parabacteroides chongii]WFE86604.1 6-bladed beta-propeller [Parabacteroides chongii]
MKTNILFILGMLLLFSGCKNENNTSNSVQNTPIIIPIEKQNAQPISLTDYVDSVKYIPLDTKDENLINHLTKVFFVDDKILVVDGEEMRILFFDKSGEYLYKIDKQGKGPEEYTVLHTVMVDEEKRIIVYDSMGHKLVYYSIDGKFLKATTEISNNALIRNIINLPNGNFLCYTYNLTSEQVGEQASGLWEIDSNGVFVRSYFAYETLYPIVHNYDNSNLQANAKESISILDIVNQKIFHLHEGKLTEYLSFKIDNDRRKEYAGKTYTEKKDYNICINFQEKGNRIFTGWKNTEEGFHTIFSKQNNESILISKKTFWDGKGKIPFGRKLFIDNNSSDILLTSFSGTDILEILEKENLQQQYRKQIEKIIAGKNETEILEMNPVLLLLYIK